MDKEKAVKKTIGWSIPVFVILLICKILAGFFPAKLAFLNLPWLLVLFPLWIGPALLLGFFAILGGITLLGIGLAIVVGFFSS